MHEPRPASRRLFVLAMLLTAAALRPAAAQQQQQGAMAEKLAAIKQNAAANQAALRQYTWSETTQVSLNGEVRSTRQSSCQYGPDGKPACTPVGDPSQQQQQQRGGLRGRIVAEKKEEMTEYMQQVKGVIGMYVPPRAENMEQSFRAGNASLAPMPGAGETALTFKNYAQQGDSMALDFSMAARKLAGLQVNSWVGDPSSTMTMSVQFATLPDGTNYPAQVVVNVPGKGIQVTTTNSNYQK